jgi:type IV pilus assembly protein PilF
MRSFLTWMGAVCSIAAAFFLTACASSGMNSVSAADSPHQDIVTDSDEPEVRRRARLRLELAATYFEQGQTTVALDELKQSLALDPNFADAYNLRGLVYMRLNDVRMSEESFRRAIALNARDGNALHNFGWLQCQQKRYAEAEQLFTQAIGLTHYRDKAKSLMALGLCQDRAGLKPEAEKTLLRSYELDPDNPVVAFNLSSLSLGRGDLTRAQFYVRQINNSDLANAESLWLGIKVERRLGNEAAVVQLGDQLRKRYPQSREMQSYQRGAYDE